MKACQGKTFFLPLRFVTASQESYFDNTSSRYKKKGC